MIFGNGAGSAAFAAALRADWGSALNDKGNSEPVAKTISKRVDKNDSLDITVAEVDGKTKITGSIRASCSLRKNCEAIVATANKLFHQDDGNIELSVDIVLVDSRYDADVHISRNVLFDHSGINGMVSTSLLGGYGYFYSDLEFGIAASANNVNHIWQHEFAHVVGFNHRWNRSSSLMSYDANRNSRFTSAELKRLADAYR